MRSGRSDALKETARDVLKDLGDHAPAVVDRVHVLTLDVDTHTDAGAAKALEVLAEHLDDPSRATAALALLQKEAAVICAGRSRRDRKALIDLLNAAGISIRPPKHTRKWHDDLP